MNNSDKINTVNQQPLENGVLKELVHTLYANVSGFIDRNGKIVCHQCLPSRDIIDEITSSLRSVLFPGYFVYS